MLVVVLLLFDLAFLFPLSPFSPFPLSPFLSFSLSLFLSCIFFLPFFVGSFARTPQNAAFITSRASLGNPRQNLQSLIRRRHQTQGTRLPPLPTRTRATLAMTRRSRRSRRRKSTANTGMGTHTSTENASTATRMYTLQKRTRSEPTHTSDTDSTR